MPSTFTPSGGYELQATGENTNAWGVRLNTSLDLLDERIDGVAGKTVTTSFNLTIENAVSSDGRKMVQRLAGTPAGDFTITLPARSLVRIFHNLSGKTATITNGTGANCDVRPGTMAVVYSDTTNGCFVQDLTLDKIKPAADDVDLNGKKATNAANGVASTDLATVGQIEAIVEPFATAAAQSASDALGSKNAAAISETNAATSESNTEDLYTDFAKRYLGPLASDPTVDEFGDPVTEGAWYFNTTADEVRVYNGAGWLPIAAVTLANQAQAEAGADNTAVMTPLRTKQAIAAQVAIPRVGLVPLTSQVVSTAVATIDFTSGISSAYDEYEFHIVNLVPASASYLWVRTSTNGGTSFDDTFNAYRYSNTHSSAGSPTPAGSGSATAGELILGNNASTVNTTANLGGICAVLRLHRPSDAKYGALVWCGGYADTNPTYVSFTGAGQRVTAADIDAVRFMFSTGNIASGRINLYGVLKP